MYERTNHKWCISTDCGIGCEKSERAIYEGTEAFV